MEKIRRSSNVILLGRKGKTESASSSPTVISTSSPFDAKPLNPLKAITERKSRFLSEGERLRLLQQALEKFAAEARRHLPERLKRMEGKVRTRMIQEGFSSEVAREAGDETVSLLLEKNPPAAKKLTDDTP